jgi:hypothetical protein
VTKGGKGADSIPALVDPGYMADGGRGGLSRSTRAELGTLLTFIFPAPPKSLLQGFLHTPLTDLTFKTCNELS